jgi:hypothetical protein
MIFLGSARTSSDTYMYLVAGCWKQNNIFFNINGLMCADECSGEERGIWKEIAVGDKKN